MARKDTLGDTAELRAAIADLQARIDAREKRIAKAESDIVQESWIQKEEAYDPEADEDADIADMEAYHSMETNPSTEETYSAEEEYPTQEEYSAESLPSVEGMHSMEGIYAQEPYPDGMSTDGTDVSEAYPYEEAEPAGDEEMDNISKDNISGDNASGEEVSERMPRERPRDRQRPEKNRNGAKKRRSKNEDDIIISLKNVSKSYVKDIPALSNVNIQIRRGEFVFIVGSSGSGKSTLIRLLLRELRPTSGSIMINGLQVDKLRRGKIPKLRRRMGVVFQDFRLLKERNV